VALVIDTTTRPGTIIIYDDAAGGVAIDNTTTLAAISSSLTTIATNSGTISTRLNTINTTLSTLNTNITTLNNHLDTSGPAGNLAEQFKRLRELGDIDKVGTGIRTSEPYGNVATAILYQLYIKQAQMLSDPDASPADQTTSLNLLKQVIDELVANLDS
jgi:hypothetical protein